MSGPILLCAATARELATAGPAGEGRILAVTGVGIPLTMARLSALIAAHRPSLVVNLGIAGAYTGTGSDLAIGDVVAGRSEIFGDLGMESPEGFLPVGGMPWADSEYRSPLPLTLDPWPAGTRAGAGCTVNACTGTEATGELRRRQFAVHFETMEGAAAALAGFLAGVPVAEIRAISNIASIRDMRPENIDKALAALGAFLKAWKSP